MKVFNQLSIFILVVFALSSCFNKSNHTLSPTSLTTEYLENPPVIDVEHPRLSWINLAQKGDRGQFQTAFQIQVATTLEKLEKGNADVWDSDKVNSSQSYLVDYAGDQLQSTKTYFWRVKVWNAQNEASDWSEAASWGMGILDKSAWTAQWIGAPWQGEEPLPDPVNPRQSLTTDMSDVKPEKPTPAPLLRKTFSVDKKVAEAKAFVTGLGYFEFYLNGKKVGNDVLIPNQTNYSYRPGLETDRVPIENSFKEYKVMYLSYDITELLQEGNNAMGTWLGNGFYNAPITWTASYGTPRFIGQIYIRYTDGTEDIIVSDETWKSAQSPILSDLVYDGEHYDARKEQNGWSSVSFDDSAWEQAVLRVPPTGELRAHMAEPDKVMERLSPLNIKELDNGKYLVDFGQEITG